MINWEKSAEINKMSIDDLKSWFIQYPSSGRKIVRICDNCKKEREIYFCGYRDLCYDCSTIDPTYCKDRSIRATEYWGNPIHREEQSIRTAKYYGDPEHRKEQSIRLTEYYKDPKHHENSRIHWNNYWSEQKHRDEQSTRVTKHFENITNREKHSASHLHIPYDEWENFAEDKLYCPDFNEECKESNRDKYGRRCFLTGLPEEKNITKNGKQQKLSVHHYDMDKGQGCNGKKWKLVPLCVSWHSKVHNPLWEARIIWLLDNIWYNNE